MPPRLIRTSRHGRIAALATGALVIVPILGASASADTAGAVTPFLDCVSQDPATGDYTAYFGYNSSFTTQQDIPVGEDNQIFPGNPTQGQPTVFNPGNYPRAFEVTFDPVIVPEISWILSGTEADAYTSATACADVVTTPAELITGTTATITGVVAPDGTDTSYYFNWGPTPSLGIPTPLTDEGSQTDPVLVQAQLTGLKPGTQYYYALDENTGFAPGAGQVMSFTTPAAPAAIPLSVTTATLPGGTVGVAYSATLTATGGTGPYTWSIPTGSLPAGLTLNPATGVISGTPTKKTTTHSEQITAEVTDSTSATAAHLYDLQIAEAPRHS